MNVRQADRHRARRGRPVYVPGTCANCGSPDVTFVSPLYCGDQCKQAAGLVRYVRKCRTDGRDKRPDVQEAIRTKTAMVLGGGYPERERRVPAGVRALVFMRAAGLCEGCGRALDMDGSLGDPDARATIQHTNGDSNDLADLRAFCRRCNLADAQSRFVPVLPGTKEAALAAELRARWSAPTPLRACDDEVRWPKRWRAAQRRSREAIEMRDELDDAWGDEDLPGFEGWTEEGTPIQDI